MTRPRASPLGSRAPGADAAVRRLLNVFGRACRAELQDPSDWQAAIEPALKRFCSLCQACEKTDQLLAVKEAHEMNVVAFDLIRSKCNDAQSMLRTCMRRIMLLMGLHSKVYSRLLDMSTISDDTYALLHLLGAMLDYPRPFHVRTGMPERPLPQYDYETLGPLYWHPKVIALVCQALASARNQGCWDAAAGYITSIIIPPEGLAIVYLAHPANWTEAAVGRKQFDAVLQDQPCMNAIWELLRSEHPETMSMGCHLMHALVKEPLPTMPMWDHHPLAFGNLLKMGGAEPITHAMQAALAGVEKFQKEGHSIMPVQRNKGKEWVSLCAPKAVLGQLLVWIDHSIALEWYLCISKKMSDRGFLCPFAWNDVGCELPAWPPDMLEAHVLCAMKGLKLEIDEPREGPTGTFDFSMYSIPWLPAVASVLSRHTWTQVALVQHVERLIATIPMKLPLYLRACNMELKFVRRILEVEGSHTLRRQLPFMRLIKCCTSAYISCIVPLAQFTRSGCTSDVDKDIQGYMMCILQETLLLLNCILDLPAGQETLAAKAVPSTLRTIVLTHKSSRMLGLPEAKVSDDTRARIEARGSQSTQSTGAAGPSNHSSSSGSSSEGGSRVPALQSEGTGSAEAQKGSGKSVGGVPARQSEGTGSAGAQKGSGGPAQSAGAGEGPSISSKGKSGSGVPTVASRSSMVPAGLGKGLSRSSKGESAGVRGE